ENGYPLIGSFRYRELGTENESPSKKNKKGFFLTPILRECKTCKAHAKLLYPYPLGSLGPKEVERLPK
ncbi:MAG: hypothetical protein MUP26_08150, partial [Desulfobulbaceae bacterium]|nr:hypothetical protein [Desulfobulbaceae bacterium]